MRPLRRAAARGFEATAFLAFLDGLRLQYFYSDGAVPLSANLTTYVDQLVARISLDPEGRLEASGHTLGPTDPG